MSGRTEVTGAETIICNCGYCLFDGVVELREAGVVSAGRLVVLLVADFDVVECEGRGMAVAGALGAPFCGGVAGDVLDFVERVLHVGLEVRAGVHVLLVEV